MEHAVILSQSEPIWFAAMTSRLGLVCAVMVVVLLVGIGLSVKTLRGVHAGNRGRSIRENDGTATVEFVLVLPFLLFLILALAQVTVMMGANVVVHYSAFAAARAAIVQVPTNYPNNTATPQLNQPPYSPYDWTDAGKVSLYSRDGDPPNRYTQGEGRIKHDKILHAAALTLMAVSGQTDGGGDLVDSAGEDVTDERLVSALGEYYAGASEPPWVETLAASRLRYALDNTSIRLGYLDIDADDQFFGVITLRDGEAYEYEPFEDIAVTVEHRLNLALPYVNRLFATGRNEGGPGYHREVSAQYTLTNQGLRDELPPEPYDYTGQLPGPLIRMSP